MIALAEPLPAGDVGLTMLISPRHEFDAQIPQQGGHEPAAVVPVGQHHISAPEFVEQRAEGVPPPFVRTAEPP